MLKYLEFTTICDVAFGAFLVTWFITRHIFFVLIIVSEYKDMLVYMPYGWNPEKGYYVTFEIWAGFLILLSSLQVYICRILLARRAANYNTVLGNPTNLV